MIKEENYFTLKPTQQTEPQEAKCLIKSSLIYIYSLIIYSLQHSEYFLYIFCLYISSST